MIGRGRGAGPQAGEGELVVVRFGGCSSPRHDGHQHAAGGNQRQENNSEADIASEEHQRSLQMLGECVENSEAEHHHLQQQQNQHQLKHQDTSACRKAALVRSKMFDASLLTPIQSELDSKLERKKSHYTQLSKGNCQYHKIFKEMSKDEQLRQSYTCALQKDILYQGRMFVSDHWICFHSKVFGKDTKIVIPVVSVTHVKKTKTALLVPNAVVIATANDRYVFVSFLARDNTYKFLMSVCLHLEEKSPCNSPFLSSSQINFRGRTSPHSPRFPLSFHADFADLDETLRKSRQDTEESSTSDSQTPDDDKMADFPVPPLLDTLKCSDVSPHPDHQHQLKNTLHFKNSKLPKQESKQHGFEVKQEDTGSGQALSLNTLLCAYLFLVCVLVLSSCFLTMKMFSLEHRLATLGSIADLAQPDIFLQGSDNVNRELFSELLSLNLKKLEKVQKNLQRLLDEAV
ncbi:GRAM domain-containing protein 2B isoform X2 [Phyllopteryx taeniolatus]|uniref:GRAM domain-containing protein 2B isoform X2 n=1 Tax=Phyllopteryx taeniolatus TaxID=161469 RepID=UPI002AD2D403|nr:GRAM domain-containing protein 2B isoform X2 [Phyllopteryx taeniolatus]